MAHATHPVRHAPDVIDNPSPSSTHSGRGLLTWAVIIAGLAVALGLALLATTSGTGSQEVDPAPPPVAPAQPGVPQSADQAERYLAEHPQK